MPINLCSFFRLLVGNIKVKIVEETPVHMDGEGMLVNEDLEFSINPLSLSVWVPR